MKQGGGKKVYSMLFLDITLKQYLGSSHGPDMTATGSDIKIINCHACSDAAKNP